MDAEHVMEKGTFYILALFIWVTLGEEIDADSKHEAYLIQLTFLSRVIHQKKMFFFLGLLPGHVAHHSGVYLFPLSAVLLRLSNQHVHSNINQIYKYNL